MEVVSCGRCHNGLCVKKVDMFKSLSHEDMLEIIKLTGHKTFKKGEYLCREGDKLSTLFIINSGKVKLSKFNLDGKEQILDILSDGQIFGEYHLFSENEPYNFSAIALSNTMICTLAKKNMDYLLEKHPSISQKILIELSKKLIRTENLVQNLSNVNTDSKVAYVLISLAESYGEKSKDSIRIKMPLTREEMANYAGVTRETMSRKLSYLISEGIIETEGYKIIIIKDIEALEMLV